MSIGIFLLLSTCLFVELNRFLAWLIRRVISAVSLSLGTKKVPKHVLELDAEGHKVVIFVNIDVLCISSR
jgi:hypothetical protein